MLPGDVVIVGSFPPFVGTFDKTQCEVAAAYVVRALHVKGNTWRAIEWAEIAEVLRADVEAAGGTGGAATEAEDIQKLMRDLVRNPFARPDFHKLAALGYARWLGEPGTSPFEFTDRGLERLRKWSRVQAVVE